MYLVKIDVVSLKAVKRSVDGAEDRPPRQAGVVWTVARGQPDFCRQRYLLPCRVSTNCLSNNDFRRPASINVRGVPRRDAEIDSTT
jgi:hypothetical protein